VDFLSGLKEGSERHMLAVKDHLYEWEGGPRVFMQERGEDQTLGLVVSQTYLELLRENYTIEAVEGNPVAGRETYLVRVVPRYQGRASVRVWVDQTWGVPLRMERYDHTGQVELRMEYESITFKEAVDTDYFKLPEGMKVRPVGRGHRYDTPETFHTQTDRLAPVAGRLPAGFRITEVTASDRGDRHSVQTFYSDGYSAFSLFAVQGTEEIPLGKDEPGVRAIESGYRRGTAYVRGWIGDVQITLVSSRLPEYELVRIIPSVRLSGKTPKAVYSNEPPPAP
jgi:negative regulator of sigma E activity